MRIKTEDLLNLKEGEVYWGNVQEEERPRVLEALKKFNATDGDVGAEQVTIPSCGPELCNRLVPFCLTTTAPFSACGVCPQFVDFGYDTCCVQCVIEPSLLEGASVTNPCDPDGPLITGCEVAVNRVRAIGAIRGFLTLISAPNCGFGLIDAANDETFCVNNVICFTCEENPCPALCNNIRYIYTSYSSVTDPCGNQQITVTGFFVLPSCV